MRKFISAVTSLAVAASMASVFVPAATVAEDATKGLTLEAFAESDSKYAAMGDNITVSEADIAAGDVTIPCAVYLHETEHCRTVASSFYVSGGPDASKVVLKSYKPTDKYWSTPHDYTIGGSAFKTDKYVSFVGTYDDMDQVYAPYGLSNMVCTQGMQTFGIDTYYVNYNWGASKAYNYTGATSDEHPVVVFDVVLPKGTAAGEYTIDFTHENTSPEEGKNNPATMVETKQRYTKELGNLDINTLKITVEGKSNPDDKTTTTTTTTTSKPIVTTTTTTNQNPNPDADVIFDFGNHKANPGDTVTVPVIINPQGNGIVGLFVVLEQDSPIEVDRMGSTSAAFEGRTFESNPDKGGFSLTTLSGPKDSDPMFIEDGLVFVNIRYKVPDNCPDGKYHIGFSTSKGEIFKDNTNPLSFACINGIIEVGDGGDDPITTTTTKPDDKTTTTTTTSSTSSTSSSTTTTNNTPDPSGEYAPTWGDTNCDGTVNVADVVVLNKWLHDSSAIAISDQGKVNADCCDPQDANGGKVKVSGVNLTAADSNAIIESIVGNVTLPTSSK